MTAGRTGAHALLDVLVSWGVEHVFTCPGTTEVPLLDALVDRTEIQFVLTTHESVAVAMADGYARASGRPGVAYLHTNVGLANGLAHLYSAHTAHSPVVVLTGVKPTPTLPRRALTAVPDIRGLARPFCKADWMTLRPDALAQDLHRALSAAVAPPNGPTFLAVPQDVLMTELTAEESKPLPMPPRIRVAPDPTAVVAAAELLTGAVRPLIIAGGEVARHGAVAALTGLAEMLGAPIVAESRRDIELTAVPTDHPHFAGFFDPSSELVRASDVVFLAGSPTFLEMEPGRFPRMPESAALVHLSEDHLELGRRYRVDVGLAGDSRLALEAMLREVERHRPAGRLRRATNLEPARAAYLSSRLQPLPAGNGALTVEALVAELATSCSADDVLVLDAVTTTEPLLQSVARSRPSSFFATATGSLGWGMGAALGVQLAQRDRRVTCVVGDGVFQFGVPALWTAREYDLPVRFVVVNNGAYAAVRSGLRRYGGRAARTGTYPLTSIGGVDAATVARGFGLAAERVNSAPGLASALAKAAAIGTPMVVDAVVEGGP